MPTVIGIDQVPREIVRPKWYSDYAYATGSITRAAILAALSGQGGGGGVGQVPTYQTPQNPGTLTFPSGATTRTSPLELAQLQQMGGVPNTQGGMTSMGQGGITYQPPTRLGLRPDVAYQTQQAQLQKAQQDLDPNSPSNQYIKAITQSLTPSQSTTPPATNEFLTGLADLSTKAQAGDEDAVSRIRMIRQLMTGS